VSSDQLAAVGAFLSGVGSVISAAWFVRRARRRAEEECDKRVAEFDRALHEGVRIGRDENPPYDR
jgi:hypothetical protein